MGRYARCVARYPYIFIILDVILALLLGPISIYIYGVPDISDPTKGFEPRGTELRGWLHTAQFILDQLQQGDLTFIAGVFNTGTTDRGQIISESDRLPGMESDFQKAGQGIFDPKRTPRLVVSPVNQHQTLLSPSSLQAICNLQDKYLISACGDKCDVISVPLLIGEHLNKTCLALDDDDVAEVLHLMQKCSKYYFSKLMIYDCNTVECQKVPSQCLRDNFVYRFLHHFTDKAFLENGIVNKTHVSHSLIYLGWKSNITDLENFYISHVHQKSISNDHVYIEGMNVMLGKGLFKWFVVQDIVWYGLAMALVVIILVIYLRSSLLMLTVILNVIFALSLSYWFYFMICRFTFFPFINILAALLLIAVGADDLFIFYDIWRTERSRAPLATQEDLVVVVLKHGGVSVFVTSFTTAAALLANLVNDVTAIRCFGAYAAICIMMNFVLFITWVPAILVIMDRSCKSKCCSKRSNKTSLCMTCATSCNRFWSQTMPAIVNRGSIFFVILFLMLATVSFVVTFWKPKLNLPSTNNVRSLIPSHPFEVYTWELKDKFRFEEQSTTKLNIQYLFGVHGQDNGNLFDANDIGHLDFDDDFSPYSELTLAWMRSFCKSLLKETFVEPTFAEHSVCYWDAYVHYIHDNCTNVGRPTQMCCNLSSLANASTNEICMKEFSLLQPQYYASRMFNKSLIVGQPLFDVTSNIKVFQIVLQTSFDWNVKYEHLSDIYNNLSEFSSEALEDAPTGLKSAWFTGAYLYEFRFYDLQKSLAWGTLSGISVSLAIGLVVLLLTTLNIVLTIYAISSIGFVLSTTAAVLALMGWELGFAEALTLTLSMGLSIDFTIHLGVAYNISEYQFRKLRVQHALDTVGSAVTMAAVTTFSAGAAMMMGQVWAYRQFGTFLVVTMVLSLAYAMLFFLPLCSLLGPVKNIGDLKYFCRKSDREEKHQLYDLESTMNQKGQSKAGNASSNEQEVLESHKRNVTKQSRTQNNHDSTPSFHHQNDTGIVRNASNDDVFYSKTQNHQGIQTYCSNNAKTAILTGGSSESLNSGSENADVFLY